MNILQFYEILEYSIQFKLDISSIPYQEAQELYNNLNDLIKIARTNEEKSSTKTVSIY